MTDDRDFSWLGGPAPVPPTYPEFLVWRVTKDSRWADARVRDVPHGRELRVVVGGQGREEQLHWSQVFRPGQDTPALATMSTGFRQSFERFGWTLQAEAASG